MGDVKSEPPTDEPEVVEQSAAPTPTHKPASVLQVQDKKKPKVSCCSESAPCAGLCWRHPIFPDRKYFYFRRVHLPSVITR